ncbi:tetratricopeptide repeat protein [Geomonas sp. Red69]|uniref:tetratricopeptide repeat protein n=1 Tax=Geomonas diazotrophica TaxID=2843197 RepID=UPI001C11EA72|nr:tetratricopeptide repeat protein [Geomonas diazotrophica]MBU5637909.1 tetratricopeptide repeat protein [Geomonas diazotrophica]
MFDGELSGPHSNPRTGIRKAFLDGRHKRLACRVIFTIIYTASMTTEHCEIMPSEALDSPTVTAKTTACFWLQIVLLVTASLLVYFQALQHHFLTNWDDLQYVLENQAIRGITPAHLREAFTRVHAGNYAPLHIISYMIDYELWGLNPAGFIGTNVLLHTVNGLIFYLLLCRIAGAKPWPAPRRPDRPSRYSHERPVSLLSITGGRSVRRPGSGGWGGVDGVAIPFQGSGSVWRCGSFGLSRFCLAPNGPGLTEDAIQEFSAAVELSPEFDKPHFNQGIAFARQGRLSDAVNSFVTAARLKPDNPVYQSQMRLAQELFAQGQAAQ